MREAAPKTIRLSGRLEARWRLVRFVDNAVTAQCPAIAATTAALLVAALRVPGLPVGRIALLAHGLGLAVALLVTALVARRPVRLLADADRECGLKSVLVSGYEIGTEDAAGSAPRGRLEEGFRVLAVAAAERASRSVVPRVVYPWRRPRMTGLAAGLLLALGVAGVVSASGIFAQPLMQSAGHGQALAEQGRRLAERAMPGSDLYELAEEIRRLGDRMVNDEVSAAEAQQRLGELGDRVEQHLRNLDRPRPLLRSDDPILPEAEVALRAALERGMGEREAQQLFMRMSDEGNTLDEIVQALEEASGDGPPGRVADLDPEQLRGLFDRLTILPAGEQAETIEELREAQRLVDQMRAGVSDTAQGEPMPGASSPEAGAAPSTGTGRQEPDPRAGAPDGEPSPGELPGLASVEDEFLETFTRAAEAGSVLAAVEGTVTGETVMEIIMRALSSEATSRLTERQQEALVQRVVEQAVGRERTPPGLEQLVRSYFLRLTMAARGATDE